MENNFNKQVNTIYLFLIISILIFAGCKKTVFKRNLNIIVIDSVYNKPIKNCKIFLTQNNSEDPLRMTAPLLFHYFQWEGQTDENGKTTVEFKPYKNKKASKIEISAYMIEFNGNPAMPLELNYLEYDENKFKIGDNEILINSPPIGYLSINLKNINPYNDEDLFSIMFRPLPGDGINLSYIKGSNIDRSLLYPQHGDKEIEINWQSKKNNIVNTWQDTVYCPAYDTITYNINY
jgi:hypothetical protein